ncbi:MAG: hypothetical protein LC768_16365 [Acidobacteria bacterium]|nr:hypothetical protein [Acidobacteriota bacterium]MCA1639873.1 hypothetical protein [Acidobacteriota bacterium]
MSNNEIKVMETDAVIFQMKFGNEIEEKTLSESENKLSEIQTQIPVIEKRELFGRLKKSLRKKSASIL